AAGHRRIRGGDARGAARGTRGRHPDVEPRQQGSRRSRCRQPRARLPAEGGAFGGGDRGLARDSTLRDLRSFVARAILGDTGVVDGGSPDPEEREATRTRVVVADDSVLLREGIASLLERAGFEIVGQSGTAEDLLLKVRSYKPDIAIVDIKMPPTQTDEGLRAAKEIREKHPKTAVLVLSQYVEEGYALELLRESAEGVGYLLKDRVYDLADFVASVRRVAEGGSALDPSVVAQLVGRRRRDDPIGALSARERE